MIATRKSPADERNPRIRSVGGQGSNREWLGALAPEVATPGAILLLGGSHVLDFRIRVAQGHLRHDLLPSFWSMAGILCSAETFLSVPCDRALVATRVPSTNGIVECRLADYDDPVTYPNVAVLNFAVGAGAIVDYARGLEKQRSAIDLPELLIAWLAFTWGAGAAPNPLLHQHGVPSAAFVETAYGIGGIELTPGVASATSCPEAMWQSAIWWHDYYAQAARAFPDPPAPRHDRLGTLPQPQVPSGAFVVRQPAAAVLDEDR